MGAAMSIDPTVRIDAARFWSTVMRSGEIGPGKAGGLRRLALTDADKEMRDLFVTWCTEAGCTVAILVKRYDPAARVVLFEKETFPRHHIGESTLPDANAVLHKLGVIDAMSRAGFPVKCGITYKWSHTRPIFSDVFSRGVHPGLQERLYPKGIPDHAWQVERGRYDAILLARAGPARRTTPRSRPTHPASRRPPRPPRGPPGPAQTTARARSPGRRAGTPPRRRPAPPRSAASGAS